VKLTSTSISIAERRIPINSISSPRESMFAVRYFRGLFKSFYRMILELKYDFGIIDFYE